MIPDHFPHVKLHDYIIMPNHIHGILELLPDDRVGPYRKKAHAYGERTLQSNRFQCIIPGSLSSIVRGYKIGVTKWHRENTAIETVWQRNFYESIIWDNQSYRNISQYIKNNPKNWDHDRFNDCNVRQNQCRG